MEKQQLMLVTYKLWETRGLGEIRSVVVLVPLDDPESAIHDRSFTRENNAANVVRLHYGPTKVEIVSLEAQGHIHDFWEENDDVPF